MSLDILAKPNNPHAFAEQVHGDAGERINLLDIADTIASMDSQFQFAEPDEKKRLQELKESLIIELTAENPGHTLLNEVILLASVYQNRVTETVLPGDGSRVKAFGTRDKHNLYLQELYVLHEKPEGGYHYMVKRQTAAGTLLFELDDQAELRITRQANKFIPAHNQPYTFNPGNADYVHAVRELFSTTLTAAGAVRKRVENQRETADMHAQFMIEDSSFARQFLEAHSSRELMSSIDALMVVEPNVMSQYAMRAIIASRKAA